MLLTGARHRGCVAVTDGVRLRLRVALGMTGVRVRVDAAVGGRVDDGAADGERVDGGVAIAAKGMPRKMGSVTPPSAASQLLFCSALSLMPPLHPLLGMSCVMLLSSTQGAAVSVPVPSMILERRRLIW
jgi:hypothetical protein